MESLWRHYYLLFYDVIITYWPIPRQLKATWSDILKRNQRLSQFSIQVNN